MGNGTATRQGMKDGLSRALYSPCSPGSHIDFPMPPKDRSLCLAFLHGDVKSFSSCFLFLSSSLISCWKFHDTLSTGFQ